MPNQNTITIANTTTSMSQNSLGQAWDKGGTRSYLGLVSDQRFDLFAVELAAAIQEV